MDLLLALALFLGAPQEEKVQFIPRVSKDIYLNAVKELDQAADMIDSEPREAVAKITGILTNSKIKYFECRLKIEKVVGETEERNFFPYQVRGRARMALAKRSESQAALEAAEAAYVDAIGDFKKSVEAKVKGSAELQKEAENRLKKVREDIEKAKVKDDPVSLIRPRLNGCLRDLKFKSAVTLINGPDGEKIGAEDKPKLLQEVEERCREYLDGKISNFRSNLGVPLGNIAGMKEREFTSAFSMPSPDEITVKDPVFDWARKHYTTLKSIQLSKAKPEEILTAAQEALGLDASGDASSENPFFKAMAGFGFELCDNGVRVRIERAAKQRKEERVKLEGEAAQFQATWKDFTAKLDKKVVERHSDLDTWSKDLDSRATDFPKEMPELASISIEECFKEDPGPALDKVESTLRNLDTQVRTKGRFAIESRQALYTMLITASALKRLIYGDSEDDVVRDLLKYQMQLKEAGGPLEPEMYGPKVKRVFERIAKS